VEGRNASLMSSVAEVYRFVVGVDTHAKVHRYAVVEAATGRVVDEAGFATCRAGLARAVAWIGRWTGGELGVVLISVEGTGSYGSRLAKVLGESGYRVVDAPCPKRDRGRDKNDAVDAIIAARSVLSWPVERLADVRGGEAQECVKVLLAARERMTAESTRAINALTALLRGAELGVDARRTLTRAQLRAVSRWRARSERPAQAIARAEAVRLATRILQLREQVEDNHEQLRQIVAEHVPVLLSLTGIGPVNAAVVLSVWSHPGRIRHEAGLARLGGVAPIEVSSGNHREHRLSRGGDRQLNRALHSVANTRMRADYQTKAYVARRTQQGLSKRRIRRCLKRYIARQIYRTLATGSAPTALVSLDLMASSPARGRCQRGARAAQRA
jgi:transposase